jgi:hypothetical protein
VWGDSAAKDPLSDYFNELFLSHNLIDVKPDTLAPSWRNGRVGPTSVSKRLDRYFISESLLTVDNRIRTWVDSPYISDHAPIILQFGPPTVRLSLPFKLNSCWLSEDGFIKIVHSVWKDPKFLTETGIQQRLSGN